MSKMKTEKFKQGGVSMFIVIVSCLLVAVIVAGFIRLMLRDQSLSSVLDISQSAYDSAQAGVEDSKRFLSMYNSECSSGENLTSSKCQNMHAALTSDTGAEDCNILGKALISASSGETKIQTATSADSKLDQAYTCVRIQKDTSDFLGQVQSDNSRTIPLKGVEAFSKVRLKWHSVDDLTRSDTSNITLDNVTEPDGASAKFYDKATWNNNTNRPAVIRAQVFGYDTNASVSAEQFDQSFAANNGVGFDEMIFYPARTGSVTRNSYNLVNGARRTGSNRTRGVSPVTCRQNLSAGGYACEVTINLGVTISSNRVAMMRLTAMYTAASFQVELLNSANNIVLFDGVQPKVDSTGRANDAFRRVESRVEYTDPNFPIPDFAVQTDESLCKDFWVTNTRNGGNLECNT